MDIKMIENTNWASVKYIASKWSDKASSYDITGEDLNYVTLGNTHHGLQCNLSGDDPNHALIIKKLQKVSELLIEIDELNKIQP